MSFSLSFLHKSSLGFFSEIFSENSSKRLVWAFYRGLLHHRFFFVLFLDCRLNSLQYFSRVSLENYSGSCLRATREGNPLEISLGISINVTSMGLWRIHSGTSFGNYFTNSIWNFFNDSLEILYRNHLYFFSRECSSSNFFIQRIFFNYFFENFFRDLLANFWYF